MHSRFPVHQQLNKEEFLIDLGKKVSLPVFKSNQSPSWYGESITNRPRGFLIRTVLLAHPPFHALTIPVHQRPNKKIVPINLAYPISSQYLTLLLRYSCILLLSPTAKQQYQITKNLLKRELKCKRVRRQAELRKNGNEASSEEKKGLLLWICKPTEKVNIYEEFETESKKRILTPACIEHALTFVKSPGFCVFDLPTSNVMFFDAHNNNRLIGFFEFIPFSAMSTKDRDDVDFLASFFHSHKPFVNPVSNFNGPCLGGKMNMLGWRKCMKPDERVGLYLAQPKITKKLSQFTEFVSQGHRAGEIIGSSFEKMANNAFQKNHKLMKKLGMPSFCNTKLNEEGSKFAASSSVAYTYDGFFNTPHEDKRDVSDFAYVQWIPTRSSTGEVATREKNFNLTGGDFVFPKSQFRINFDRLDGVARMVWRATEYRHFTMQRECNDEFDQLGF
ncbi:hypothetical protein PSHT_14812 [Puccinia striiformis]|uniref:Tet-like 2OG-Fe(II) oxygenase domain-containing protein n=1 Tax=Puccinia striiformis TaxID=27350 RepID=A0A2S4UI75_9BASI|nr:hypothetical protein PSHT_14812 [Puccinia striiformis]